MDSKGKMIVAVDNVNEFDWFVLHSTFERESLENVKADDRSLRGNHDKTIFWVSKSRHDFLVNALKVAGCNIVFCRSTKDLRKHGFLKDKFKEKVPSVYIAGPMRGIEYFNFPAFDQARNEMSKRFATVRSPADMDRENGFDPENLPADQLDRIVESGWKDSGEPEIDYLNRDVEALKKSTHILLLPGWTNSTGAMAEYHIAKWLGLEVLYHGNADCESVMTSSIRPIESFPTAKSEGVLEEAIRITSGDRQASYGPADQDFRRTADLWTALFGHMLKPGCSFEPFQIASAMIALKLSRQTHQRKRDLILLAMQNAGKFAMKYPSKTKRIF